MSHIAFSSVKRVRRMLEVATLVGIAAQTHADQACQPLWEEDFESGLDLSTWNIIEGDGCAQGLCGWGNNEAQFYDPEALAVEEGLLRITASVDDEGIVRSGKITTAGKAAFQHGRIEASIRLPEGRGLWPAFWMMPDNKRLDWPLEGEVDILEWTGHEPHRLIGAIHFGDRPPDNVHYSETLRAPAVWSGAFHTFGVLWSSQRIVWYVDGQTYGMANPKRIAPWRWVFDQQPFHLILNMAVGGTLGGEVVLQHLPATVEVDWVRVFDLGCQQDLLLDDSAAGQYSPTPSARSSAG